MIVTLYIHKVEINSCAARLYGSLGENRTFWFYPSLSSLSSPCIPYGITTQAAVRSNVQYTVTKGT